MPSNSMSQFVSRVEFHVLYVISIFFLTNIMHTSSLLNMSVRTSCTSIHHLVRHYEDSNNWCLLSNSFATHFGTLFHFSFSTRPLKIVKSALQLTFRGRTLITSRISLLANYFSSLFTPVILIASLSSQGDILCKLGWTTLWGGI